MPSTFKAARVRQWRGKWYLIFHDHTRDGAPERRLSCESLKATTPEGRAELLKQYRTRTKVDEVEAIKRGGALAYDTRLTDGLTKFLDRCNERVEVREENPEARKEGLSFKTRDKLKDTVEQFRAWLNANGRSNLTTGALDKDTVERFMGFYARTPGKRGKQAMRRSAATVNGARRNLRACLRYLNELRPPMIPDFAVLAPALRPSAGDAGQPKTFKPGELVKFLDTAIEREDPARTVRVHLKHGKRKRKDYEQKVSDKSATPASRLILLLALTGMRLGEALALKWSDVDVQRGRVHIFAQKTGRRRILSLIGGPEGDIAPRFVELLREWKLQAGNRIHVLPHDGLSEPLYPKSAWQLANTAAKLRRIGPQALRQNFCSYACSLGVPEGVAALWQGHSPNVARDYYRQQVLKRDAGKTFEEAMGLTAVIKQMLNERKAYVLDLKAAGA